MRTNREKDLIQNIMISANEITKLIRIIAFRQPQILTDEDMSWLEDAAVYAGVASMKLESCVNFSGIKECPLIK